MMDFTRTFEEVSLTLSEHLILQKVLQPAGVTNNFVLYVATYNVIAT